jgi:septum formation protein
VSAVSVARSGEIVWRTVDTARLTMRDFSDDFLETYLSRNAEAVLRTVGGYEIEGEGLQLFDRIDGDYFTILGLPLMELLGFLRQHGALQS